MSPAETTTNNAVEEAQQLNADVIVECYLDAKYCHYDPVELNDFVELDDLVDFTANLANMIEEDNIA